MNPPVMEARRHRLPHIHHAWTVVIATWLIFLMNSGLSGYLIGVFQPVWLREFGWPSTWLATAFSVGTLLPGLTGVIIGRWTDRYGPRMILLVGATLAGLAYMLLAGVNSFFWFAVAFGISALGRIGLGQVPTSSGVARWFRTRRSLAMGLATTGISAAGIILVPLATWLVLSFGWRTAVFVLGLTVWVVLIPLIWFTMGKMPGKDGVEAYGEHDASAAATSPPPDVTLGTAVQGILFWIIALGQMLGNAGSVSIGFHAQNALIEKGVTAPQAASAISLMALTALTSRFVYSWLGDIIPVAPLLAFCYLLQGAGYAILTFTMPGQGVWMFAVVYGLGLGGSVALQALVIIEMFGVRGYGAILGAVYMPTAITSALSPIVAAAGHDITGSYTVPFLGFVAIGVLGAICFFTAFLISRRRAAPAP